MLEAYQDGAYLGKNLNLYGRQSFWMQNYRWSDLRQYFEGCWQVQMGEALHRRTHRPRRFATSHIFDLVYQMLWDQLHADFDLRGSWRSNNPAWKYQLSWRMSVANG
jgi:hypothetical protein